MKDELLDKSALVTSAYDQVAAREEAAGNTEAAETSRKVAESAAELGKTLRRILERRERRCRLIDEVLDDMGLTADGLEEEDEFFRAKIATRVNKELERRGFKKDGEWLE